MSLIRLFFLAGYALITLAFAVCGFALVWFALLEIWDALGPAAESSRERFNTILESIGLLTIATASLELGQTVLEEEIQRKAHTSTPTRLRRFLSRFMIVVVVSLSIEFLVAVFGLVHDDPAQLPAASAIGIAVAVLLAGWGLFIWFNKHAEEMERTKREDEQIG
ncbi:MAG: hypothetical protein ACHBNF_13255 [Chromatiales bacterium]